MPNQIAQVVRMWLEHTTLNSIFRKEAAEIALLIGKLSLKDRWKYRDNRQDLLGVALVGINECENEVVSFVLEACERTTEQQFDRRTFSGIEPDEKMPKPDLYTRKNKSACIIIQLR